MSNCTRTVQDITTDINSDYVCSIEICEYRAILFVRTLAKESGGSKLEQVTLPSRKSALVIICRHLHYNWERSFIELYSRSFLSVECEAERT